MNRTLVLNDEHVHAAFGIAGNLLFVVAAMLFFKAFDQYYAVAVSLFVIGSTLMPIGSLGNGLRRRWEHRERQSSSPA